MFKLFKYLKVKDYIMIAVSLLLIVAQVFLDLELPNIMGEITKKVTMGTSVNEVWASGLKMLGFAVLSAVLSVIVGFFASKIASNFSYSVRQKEFEKISSFSMNEMKKFSVPSLITRTTNDITQIQMLISMGLQVMIKAPVLAIVALIKILGKSWELSTVLFVALLILVVSIVAIILVVLPKFKKAQKLVDNINKVSEENLQGVKVVRAFNAESYEKDKFENANDDLTKNNLFTSKWLSVLFPILNTVMSGVSLAIYYVGCLLINKSDILARPDLLQQVTEFSSYGLYVVMGFVMLSMIFMILPRAQVSAKRINEVLSQDVLVKQGDNDFNDVQEKGLVELKNVSFKYPDGEDYVLENISFKLNKGETLGIVGSSGSGKTSLVNLISRIYDASSGEVLIDNQNIKDYTFDSLYNKVGYIPQQAVLFSSSVSENVAFGDTKDGVSKQDILDAVELSQAKDFVENMDGQYDAKISQGGINVSGGQKQRLSIARTIARKPEILIFDDSFSALDYKTDKKLRQEISQKLNDTTCIIVASRVGTIKDADKILVLDDGKMVGLGTHKQLLENCKVYEEIVLSQLSKQEIEG